MQIIRSAIFHLFMGVWTPLIFMLLSPLLLTFNQNLITIIGYIWAKGILIALKIICNLDYEISGEENVPQAPFILASKHQSSWETVFLSAYFRNAKFILKQELTRIPFYGWYLLSSGMIHINRGLGISAIKKIVKDTTSCLKAGKSVIIFPEGTRVKPGEPRDIQPGIAAIHKCNKNIPIIPITLNSGLYWPKGLSLIKPGKITIKFLSPINEELQKEALLKRLKENIDYNSNLLESSN